MITYMILWYRDMNHRVYAIDKDGRTAGDPTERGHWVPLDVVEETTRSWILSNRVKVPKNTVFPSAMFANSESQVNDIVWFSENIRKIVRQVEKLDYGVDRYKNISKLRAIYSILEERP